MSFRTSAHIPGKVGCQQIDVCCQIFANALQTGTDNEGYGGLIYFLDDSFTWTLGTNLPRPFHCPWCGAEPQIKFSEPDHD